MVDLTIEVTYFEKPGPSNTDNALQIAKKYADLFGVKDIVVASTTGMVGEKAAAMFEPSNYNLVVIAHSYYFVGAKQRQEFDESKLNSLREKGVKIFFGTHAMAGIERNIRISSKDWCFVDLMAKLIPKGRAKSSGSRALKLADWPYNEIQPFPGSSFRPTASATKANIGNTRNIPRAMGSCDAVRNFITQPH